MGFLTVGQKRHEFRIVKGALTGALEYLDFRFKPAKRTKTTRETK
jgi:hypothetical protein